MRGNTKAQVNVVGHNVTEKILVLGECKWTRLTNSAKVLKALIEEKAEKIISPKGNWKIFFAGFSRSGWTSGASNYAEQITKNPPSGVNWTTSEIRLVDLAQIDKDLQEWTA